MVDRRSLVHLFNLGSYCMKFPCSPCVDEVHEVLRKKKTPNMSISSSVDGLFVSICGSVMDWGTVESSHQYNGPRKTNMNHIHFTCFIKTNYDCHEPLLSLWFMTIPRTITVLCCVYFIQIYCLESHFKILEGNILCVTSGSNSSFA